MKGIQKIGHRIKKYYLIEHMVGKAEDECRVSKTEV